MAEKCKGEWGPAKNREHCERPATHGGYCIYHWPSPDKNEEFLKVLEKDVRSLGDPVDLRGAIFYDVEDTFNCLIRKEILIDHAEFRQDVTITNAIFSRHSSFSHATFCKSATFGPSVRFESVQFDGAMFPSGVLFSDVDFQYVSFKDSTLGPEGGATFKGCKFHNRVSFEKSEIRCPTHFDDCSLDASSNHPKGVIDFTDSRISGLNFLASTLYLNGNMYLDHAKCDKRFLSGRIGRPTVRDESHNSGASKEGDDWRLVEFYRHIHAAKYDSSQFREASEFYVSFMAARRSSEKRRPLNRFIMGVYGLLSRYGQSIVRPLVLLLTVWVIVSLLLCVSPDFTSRANTTVSVLDSEPVSTVSDALSRFFEALFFTVSHSTIDRNSPMTPAVTCWQGKVLFALFFVNILLASFVGVGIKHQVRPTTPVRKT